ncbi:MAG: type IX secretion system protein PorQ [Ignavibacteriaceae bacterium]|nr:type IX secretion system protein PorQ [Ignavibacteriaceae bacterium]
MKYKLALTFFFLLLLNNSIFSQNTYDFLRLDMSARAAALGGTFVSNTDDPNVLFYNPAGLKMLDGSPISFSFLKYLLDINLASITYSTEFENIGRFAAGIKYVNYGKFTAADEFGNVTGEYGAGEAAFIVGYSNIIDKNFYYGISAKFIYSSLADRSSSAMAVDLGLNYNIPDQDFSAGFAILNAGGQLSTYYSTKESLPLDVTIGASKKLAHLPLNLSLDFHRLNDTQSDFVSHLKAFSIGAEFTLSKVLRLRLGYDNLRRQELTIGTTAGLAGFNAGLGAVIKGYSFDYGYSSLGEIGAWHRVSIATTL